MTKPLLPCTPGRGEDRATCWLYHTTLIMFLPSIARSGLLPRYSQAAGAEVIFCEEDEAGAAIYHEPGSVMLRWRLKPDQVAGTTAAGESVWPDIVPAGCLQMRKGDRWFSLAEMGIGPTR